MYHRSPRLQFAVRRGEDTPSPVPGPSEILRNLAQDLDNPEGCWEDFLPVLPFGCGETTCFQESVPCPHVPLCNYRESELRNIPQKPLAPSHGGGH